jgi:hypothetical protein
MTPCAIIPLRTDGVTIKLRPAISSAVRHQAAACILIADGRFWNEVEARNENATKKGRPGATPFFVTIFVTRLSRQCPSARHPRQLVRTPQMPVRRIRQLVGQSRPLLVRDPLTPLRLLQERALGDVGMAAR